MHHEIEPAPALGQCREQRIKAGLGGDVGLQHEIALQAFRQWPDPLAERVPLIGEGKPGPMGMQLPGNAPGDRAFVGDAHDEALLAGHQAHFVLLQPRLRYAGTGREPPAG